MQVRNARRWAARGPQAWLVAVAALALATLVRLMLHPLLGAVMPGAAFFVAAAFVEYFYGLAPATMVMLVGVGLAYYLFIPPFFELGAMTRNDFFLIVSYLFLALILLMLIERLRRAQFRAELMALVAQSRYEILLRRDNERAVLRQAADETHRLVVYLAQHNEKLILIQGVDRNEQGPRVESPQGVSLPAPSATEAGPLYDQVDTEDIKRFRSGGLTPGHHRVHLRQGEGFRLVDCICERFTTHAGDFLTLRAGE